MTTGPAYKKAAASPASGRGRRWRWLPWVAAIAAGIAGVGAAYVLLPRTDAFYTDADTINEPAASARLRDVLWQPPQPLPDWIDAESDEYEPKLSADGLTLFFVRGKAGKNADIYYARRTPAGWTEPQVVAEVNTEYDELGPEPAADGRMLYFYSDRPGGIGGYDLWAVRQPGGGRTGYGEAVNLGSRVNSEFNDYGPALTPDGKTLYFASNRPQPTDAVPPNPEAWPGTIREDVYHRTYDLYLAPINEQGIGTARPLTVLNTTFNEGAPAVSPFRDFLYFASDRPGGEGGFDLYRSRILADALEPPANLGRTINTPANELDPGLTMGGYALYFSSDRKIDRLDPDRADPPYRVFQSTSREVFARTESRRVTLDWAALWSAIGLNLSWALLALLLLLLLLMLVRAGKGRRLSLLARCLLASLAVHLLLMLLFNVWEVSAFLARELGGRGPIQIALVASARGDELASQIRGEFTEVSAPPPTEFAATHRPAPVEAEPRVSLAKLEVDRHQVTIPREVRPVPAARDARPVPNSQIPENMPRLDVRPATILPNLTLPADHEKVRQAENDPVPPSFAAESAAARHRPRPAEAVDRVPESASVTLPPSTIDFADAGTAERSLARSFPEFSTAAEIPVRTPHNAVKPALRQPAILEVSLPAETQRHAGVPESTEAMPPPPQRQFASPRKPLAPVAVLAGRDMILPQLEPLALDVAGIESSLAWTGTADIGDVRQASTAALPTNPGVTALAGLAPAAISLPKLEEATTLPPGATAPLPAFAKLQGARRPPDASTRPHQAQPASAFDLAPAAGIAPPDFSTSLVDARPEPAESVAPTRGLAGLPLPLVNQPLLHSTFLDVRIPTETLPPESPHAGRPRDQHRLLPADERADSIGIIRGRVTDASDGRPLSGATVKLDLPERPSIEVTTGLDGSYELLPPEVPAFFALSASQDGYLPTSYNVAAALVRGTTLTLDFELERQTAGVVAVEDVPQVHHLGDDDYDGRINSRFQKNAEGPRFAAEFDLTAAQLAQADEIAALTMLVKGVQLDSRIRLNGRFLEQLLNWSPSDGSFGVFIAAFDAAFLRPGRNTIEILAERRGSDVDDFEFVNMQIHLAPLDR